MRQLAVLQFLATAVRGLATGTTFPIYLPNEPIPPDANDADLYFEVFCSGQNQEKDTERSTISGLVGSIVASGKGNVGIALVDKVADDLMFQFSPVNRFQKKDFTVLDGELGRSERFYVVNAERSESGIDEGRYKTTIFLTFEVFEDKI